MNRRRFITMLGMAPVVAKLSPLLSDTLKPFSICPPLLPDVPIAQYCDYINFSDFAATEPFSPEVLATAARLADWNNYYSESDSELAEALDEYEAQEALDA